MRALFVRRCTWVVFLIPRVSVRVMETSTLADELADEQTASQTSKLAEQQTVAALPEEILEIIAGDFDSQTIATLLLTSKTLPCWVQKTVAKFELDVNRDRWSITRNIRPHHSRFLCSNACAVANALIARESVINPTELKDYTCGLMRIDYRVFVEFGTFYDNFAIFCARYGRFTDSRTVGRFDFSRLPPDELTAAMQDIYDQGAAGTFGGPCIGGRGDMCTRLGYAHRASECHECSKRYAKSALEFIAETVFLAAMRDTCSQTLLETVENFWSRHSLVGFKCRGVRSARLRGWRGPSRIISGPAKSPRNR